MRLRQVLRWTAIVVLVIPLGYCTRIAALNYSGYCFEQDRYLSDDERIRMGIDGVLSNYQLIRFVPEEMPAPGRPAPSQQRNFRARDAKGIEITQDQLILYRDAEEFVALNPGCCNFGPHGLYGDFGAPDLWMKVTGYDAGYFNAKYQIRYRDSTGQIQSGWTGVTYHVMNCGRGHQYY
jgi:hypothetical protein